MKTINPLIVLFSGIFISFLTFYFFGNSLFSSDEESSIKVITQQLPKIEKNSVDKSIALELTNNIDSLRDDFLSLRSELQYLKERPSANVNNDNSSEQFAMLNKKIKILQETIDQIKEEQSNLVSLPSQGEPSSNKNPFDTVATDQINKEKHRQNLEKLSNSFYAEPIDSQWSLDVKQKITGFFDNEANVQTSLSTVECKSTMCIVEVTIENQQAQEMFMLNFPTTVNSLPRISYDTTNNEDGSVSVRMYMAKNDPKSTPKERAMDN